MNVKDLGLGSPTQGLNIDTSFQSSNHYRIRFFNFISLSQYDSQKLKILSIIASFYSFIQNIYISFWPYLDLTTKEIKETHDYLREPLFFEENIANALFFYSTDKQTKKLALISFIIFFISIFFFIISLICFILYFFKHIVNFQLLFCYNFFIRFVCTIIAVPIGFQTGWLISQVNMMSSYEEDGTGLFITIIILNIILYLIIISVVITSSIFNSKSIIITDNYSFPNSGLFQSYITLFPSIILFLSNVLPLFYSNLRYLVIALHILFCISVVIWSFWLPYGKIKYNGFVSSASISMLISDLHCLTSVNRKWERYIIFIFCFFVFFIIMNLFVKLRIKLLLKKYKSKENKDNSVEYEEGSAFMRKKSKPPRFQLFGDPDVEPTGFENLSVSKALFVLRTSILTQSPVFLDGRLLDMLAAKVYTDDEKIGLAFLICYFPDFQPIFFALLTGLKHARFLPILSEFQLFQLRCYEISCHPNSNVEELDEVVQESSILEVYLRSYWQILDSECSSFEKNLGKKEEKDDNNELKNSSKLKVNLFPQFDRLSRAVFNCHSKWKSIISLYPNNAKVADEYTKFLINCHGDFIGASEWKTISLLLQDGKNYKVNPAQVSFLRSFPNYVKQVLPKSNLIKGFDDIEFQNKLDNIENIIEMPEARFEFQRSANSSFPISIYAFLFISLLSLLFIFIFWIYGISCFGSFDNMIERLNFLSGISYLSQQVSINLILGIIDYFQLPNVNVFPTPDEIFSSIFSNGYNDRAGTAYSPSLIQLNGDYKSQLFDSAESSIEIINYLRNSALQQVEMGLDIQSILDVFYSHSMQSDYYISIDEKVTSTEGLQSLLFSHITYYFTMSFEDNYDYVNDPMYYHALIAGNSIIETLDGVSEKVIKTNDKALNQKGFLYKGGLICLTVVYVIISVIFIWVDFFFIYRSFRSISSSLLHFPKKVKQKAACSIIDDKNSETKQTVNDESIFKEIKSKIKNVVLICLLIDSLINLFLGGLILYFHFVNNKYKDNFVSITELSHYYSLETSKSIEVIYSLMAANTFVLLKPFVYQKYKEKLKKTITDFVKIHQQCWNYSVEGDCGIKGEYLIAINDLKNQEKCPNLSNKTYHELISCLAEEPAVNAFIDLTNDLIGQITNQNLLKTDQFKQYIHFALAHLYYDIQNFAHFLSMGANVKQNEFITLTNAFGIISIVIACLLFILKIFIFLKIREIFKLLFTFISRVLPSDLVKNSSLLHSLLGIKNNNKTVIENSGISFLVQESKTPIIFLDRSTLIEFINDAFSNTFGYEPNFIVGQPISTLIDDESVLFFIDSLRFFESKKSEVKTILCKKGKGNKALFDVTFIPIHSIQINKQDRKKMVKDKKEYDNLIYDNFMDENILIDDEECLNNDGGPKNSFIHCIALVFVEKTSELNIQKKCKLLNSATEKIEDLIFPHFWNLYSDGYLKMCAICIIKLQNSFNSNGSSERVLTQRLNLYDMLYEKLQIYPLLVPIDAKNGTFTVIACKKSDPVELAVECLNFAFNIINEVSEKNPNFSYGSKISGPLFAVVETGGELVIGWTGNKTKKTIMTGEMIDRASKVLDNASLAGNVCVSRKTYDFIMQHDYVFAEKKISEDICGVNVIYSIDCNDLSKKLRRDAVTNDSNATGFSSSFIEKLKEEGGGARDEFHLD